MIEKISQLQKMDISNDLIYTKIEYHINKKKMK